MKNRYTTLDFPGVLVIVYALLAVGLALTSFASAGCDPAATAKVAGKAVIDCTKLNADKLGAIVDELKTLLAGERPDWDRVKARAITAGQAIGGCALAIVVTSRSTASSAAPGLWDPGAEGRAVLEEFRRDHAGGATFRLPSGDV